MNDPQKLYSYSCERQFSEVELDAVEMTVYGDIKRDDRNCVCKSRFELQPTEDLAIQNHGRKRRQERERLPNC